MCFNLLYPFYRLIFMLLFTLYSNPSQTNKYKNARSQKPRAFVIFGGSGGFRTHDQGIMSPLL